MWWGKRFHLYFCSYYRTCRFTGGNVSCTFVFVCLLAGWGGRGEVGSELSKVFNVQKPNTEIEVGVPGTLTIYQIFTNSTYLPIYLPIY